MKHLIAFTMMMLLWFMPKAHANGIFFDTSELVVDTQGQATLSVIYDFTEFAVISGGFDLGYDFQSLEFVSFEFFPPIGVNFGGGASEGQLVEPGLYAGVSFATKFFNGFNDTAVLGTFVFNVSEETLPSTAPGCAENAFVCLLPNPTRPFVSLAGQDVTEGIFDNSGTVLIIPAQPVPLPAALWLLLGGVGVLAAWARV